MPEPSRLRLRARIALLALRMELARARAAAAHPEERARILAEAGDLYEAVGRDRDCLDAGGARGRAWVGMCRAVARIGARAAGRGSCARRLETRLAARSLRSAGGSSGSTRASGP